MSHFLQSKQWAEFQEALGRKVFFRQGDDWHFMAVLEKGRLNTRLYCPYGPVLDTPQALTPALEALKQLGREQHVTFLRIEPTGNIKASNLSTAKLKKVTYLQLQPEHTQLINLARDEDAIIAEMSQNTRNLYRNYEKKGVSIHMSTDPADISIFTGFIHQVAKRNGITPHTDTYFNTQAKILLTNGGAKIFYAVVDNTPIAAAFIYDDDTTRYYAHAAADDEYRKLSAGTALLAYMIIDAKRNGLKTFDLYGIAPDDSPSHPWVGFTKFKKSFGGEPYSYAGAWDLPLSSFGYTLYRIYQTLSHR